MTTTKRRFWRGLATGMTAVLLVAAATACEPPDPTGPIRYQDAPIASYQVNGVGYATLIRNKRVYLGGTFSQVRTPGGTTVANRANIAAFEYQAQLAGAGDDNVGRAVLVAESMTADDDRVSPAWNQPGDVLDDNRFAEDGAAQDVADCAVGALPHCLELEFPWRLPSRHTWCRWSGPAHGSARQTPACSQTCCHRASRPVVAPRRQGQGRPRMRRRKSWRLYGNA